MSRQNYNGLCHVVGEDNVASWYVHDEYRRRTLWDYVKALWFFPFGYFFGLTPRRVDEVVKLAQGFDYVFIDRSIFGVIAKRLKTKGYGGRVITYFHNVEPVYFGAKLSRRLPGRGVLLRCVARNERYACRYSDVVVALNTRDGRDIEARYGRKADVIVPVALADRYRGDADPSAMTSTRPLCLFLGAYFKPNNDGILWFVRHVLPHVDVRVRIVGKGMARLKEENADLLAGIEVVADAPSLEPHFREADIMVLPIFSGSGMKVKTCESLMFGKNIVGTSEAFEGYDVDCNRVGGCCNTAEEFSACLRDFAEHPRPRFNAYSREMYLSKYCDAAVASLYRDIVAPSAD